MPAIRLPKILPMLSTPAAPFDSPSWVFDVKWDGVRALAAVGDRTHRVWEKEGQDYTDRYPELACLQELPAGTMLDGELVMLRDGRPDFHALMSLRHARRPKRAPYFAEAVTYVVFDVLHFRGRSLLDAPLRERKQLLVDMPGLPFVSLCESVEGQGKAFFDTVVAQGHEGVVAKRLDSKYTPGRGSSWLKVKQRMELPCVVIGYRVKGRELRDLLMATVVDGELAFGGVVELGSRACTRRSRSSRAISRRGGFGRKCSATYGSAGCALVGCGEMRW